MRKVRRGAVMVAVFVVGLVVGRLTGSTRQPVRDQADYSQPITIRQDEGRSVYLVPYAVARDGSSARISEKGVGPMWVVWHCEARVQVAYTEAPDPRTP